MAAALLLRQGARRIGGSLLQRATSPAATSPAFAEERRLLLVPRLRTYVTKEQANEEIKRKIQQKKEELYGVICKAEQSFVTSSLRNKRLLMHLSVHVKPRPNEFKWQWMHVSKRALTVVEVAGLIALTYYVGSGVFSFGKFIVEETPTRYLVAFSVMVFLLMLM